MGTAMQTSTLARLNKASSVSVSVCVCVCLASNPVELRHLIPTERTRVRRGPHCTTLWSFSYRDTHTLTHKKKTHTKSIRTATNSFCCLYEWDGIVGFTWSCWGAGWGPGPGCPQHDGGVSGHSAAGSAGGGSVSRPHGETKLPAGALWLLISARHNTHSQV